MASRTARGHRRLRRSAKSVLHQQLGSALAELGGRPPLRDASVHEVRKELKRARATLRLLRDTIGETTYRRANQRLRDAARPLSRIRDARVMLDAAASQRRRTKDASRRAELSSLEQGLRATRHRARSEVLERPATLRRVRHSIESVLEDSRQWPTASPASLGSGVERLYRSGRKAFRRAEEDRRDEPLHESRKRTKYLGRALEVLGSARHGEIAKLAKRADAIADALGDDRDLALLRRRLMARRTRSSSRRRLLADIERRRQKLQRRASKEGRRLYRRKAKVFMDALDSRAGTR